MNPTITSVILLAVNTLLFIYVLSPTVSVTVTLVLIIMAAVLLANIYKVGVEYVQLEDQAEKNKALIARQKRQIKENEDRLERLMGELVSKDKGMIKEELLKVSEGRADRDERIKEDFWEKLEKSVSAAPGSPVDKRLAELQTKRSEITELIEYSKKKYIKHELDEESFKGIVRDYHKELIEIENQIKRLGGETA